MVKQVSRPEGIWYTPVTGIWQTVWLEPVAGKHIENLRITPDIDRHLLTVKAELNTNSTSDFVEVNVYDGNQLIAAGKSINGEPVEVAMPENAKLWSPDSPFLYTLKVTLKEGNKIVDKVDSYAAMRKYSTRRDANGIVRLERIMKRCSSLARLIKVGGLTVCIRLLRMKLCCMTFRRQKILVII